MSKEIISSNSGNCQAPVEILSSQATPRHPFAEFVFSVAYGSFIFNELQARRDNNGNLKISFPTARVAAPTNGSNTIPAVWFRTLADRRNFNNAVLAALEQSSNHQAVQS